MLKNTRIIQLPCYSDNTGNLVPIEALDTIPFRLKRVYYIFGTSTGAHRGFHAHIALEQLLICVSGSVTILVKNPQQEEEILLDTPTKGLYIGPYVWREMYNFSEDAVLLVLANHHYNEKDYIRIYKEYERMAQEYFQNN